MKKKSTKNIVPLLVSGLFGVALASPVNAEPLSIMVFLTAAATVTDTAGKVISNVAEIAQSVGEAASSPQGDFSVIFYKDVEARGKQKKAAAGVECHDAAVNVDATPGSAADPCEYDELDIVTYEQLNDTISSMSVYGVNTVVLAAEDKNFMGKKIVFLGMGDYDLRNWKRADGSADFNDEISSYKVFKIADGDYTPVLNRMSNPLFDVVISTVFQAAK